MSEFNLDTTEKIVSLIVGISVLLGYLYKRWRGRQGDESENTSTISNANTNSLNSIGSVGSVIQQVNISTSAPPVLAPDQNIKRNTKILFIDDDKTFKIVGVLRRMGWEQVKLIKDVNNLEEPEVLNADVMFIDIQGVGKKLGIKDEGLGLALAIKRRHPSKKIVIYSAQEHGERFHQALSEADYSLPKNAEPVRFEETILRVIQK